MAKHSPARANWPLFEGPKVIKRGKAWDSYRLANRLRWLVATDCASIYEFSLNHIFPLKGACLVTYCVFWHLKLSAYGIKTHIVAFGSGIDKYIPEQYRNNPDIQSRSLIVSELDMISDYELIVRKLITGHGWEEYEKTGKNGGQPSICGQPLPKGLQDGDMLPYTMFTPTTKVDKGHDTNVPADPVRLKYPSAVFRVLQAFDIAFNYAWERNVVLADDKKECDKEGNIADETFTIDSSRWTPKIAWLKSREPATGRKMSSGFDKQYLRNKGIEELGINKLDPDKPADIAKVHAWKVPDEAATHFIQGGKYLFWLLSDMNINRFRRGPMGISLPPDPPKNVLLVCGSETDFPVVKSVCEGVRPYVTVDITSCHRNPNELVELVKSPRFLSYDLVAGVGSEQLGLPGDMDAWAHYFCTQDPTRREVPVAGVALGSGESLLAARMAIKRVPGQPLIMKELEGEPYVGPEGLRELLLRITNGELPPPQIRKEREAKPGFWQNF